MPNHFNQSVKRWIENTKIKRWKELMIFSNEKKISKYDYLNVLRILAFILFFLK